MGQGRVGKDAQQHCEWGRTRDGARFSQPAKAAGVGARALCVPSLACGDHHTPALMTSSQKRSAAEPATDASLTACGLLRRGGAVALPGGGASACSSCHRGVPWSLPVGPYGCSRCVCACVALRCCGLLYCKSVVLGDAHLPVFAPPPAFRRLSESCVVLSWCSSSSCTLPASRCVGTPRRWAGRHHPVGNVGPWAATHCTSRVRGQLGPQLASRALQVLACNLAPTTWQFHSHTRTAAAERAYDPAQLALPWPRGEGATGITCWRRCTTAAVPLQSTAEGSRQKWPHATAHLDTQRPHSLRNSTQPPKRQHSSGRIGTRPVSTPREQAALQTRRGPLALREGAGSSQGTPPRRKGTALPVNHDGGREDPPAAARCPAQGSLRRPQVCAPALPLRSSPSCAERGAAERSLARARL